MMTSKPLVFFGTEDFSRPSLQALIDGRWPIALVVTKPDSARGRGRRSGAPAIKRLARAHGIEVLQPERVADINSRLGGLAAEYGVLVAYGKLIPATTLDKFSGGIINVHPSLLPRYRGPAPIEAAILNGDHRTGVSLMKLTAEMDAGPVYKQRQVPLSGHENRPNLYGHLTKIGAEMLAENLPRIIDGSIIPAAQDESEATYTKLLEKSDGLIDWSKPAQQLEREVRAYAGWPKSRAQILGREIIITKARALPPGANDFESPLVEVCGDGSLLEIQELIAPSGRTVSGADFMRGYRP